MSAINNDSAFKAALDGLGETQQRRVAALFTRQLLSETHDIRVRQAVETLLDGDGDADEETLASLAHSVKSAIIASHTRCGAESDWEEQQRYFVARAAYACVASRSQSKNDNLAWQAAVACRTARTCGLIFSDSPDASQENIQQYQILADFLQQA